MKVSLVVASGAHQGKVIPISGLQFLIGRDPQCQLRPASQAVSKQHCGVIIRDGKVFLRDYGSTNGTVLNDAIVKGEERPVSNNDLVKVGPLDFTIRIEAAALQPDGTPLPDLSPDTAAALAAVKAVSAAARPSAGQPTPMPKTSTGSKETPALKPGSKESTALSSSAPSDDVQDHDRIAAMLLGLNDDDVPGGSTVVDLPAVNPAGQEGQPGESKEGEKKDAKKSTPSREETSSAASEILRRYMRRPK
jgi:predicted component of type VI protein secretion system